ncbi:MAG: MraY family glycosyltransferase [Gammaproteobacteria bacterium]
MSVYYISLAALASTTLLILLLRPLALVTGLVDMPNERKSHQIPTPLVGGLAIFAGLAMAFLLTVAEGVTLQMRETLSFFGGGLLLVTVGVVDDFIDLSPLARFVAQIVAALLMIFGAGVVLHDLGGMTPSGQLLTMGVLAVPFTVFATLGVINALNMCDGLDGLSGSLSLVSLSGLFLAAWLWGDVENVILLPLLGSAVLGFLLFNLRLPGRERASIFMGDAGSMFLGFALTWYAVSLSQGESRVITPAAALWFLMLPIFDTVTMMLRRILRGRSPFSPDREHLHHVFLLAGYTVNETVGLMAAVAGFGVLVGLASVHWQLPELLVAGAFLLAGLGYFWMIMHAWRVMRFLHRSICRRRITSDRRCGQDPAYAGPERRSGTDRRLGAHQRTAVLSSVRTSSPMQAPALSVRPRTTSNISS